MEQCDGQLTIQDAEHDVGREYVLSRQVFDLSRIPPTRVEDDEKTMRSGRAAGKGGLTRPSSRPSSWK